MKYKLVICYGCDVQYYFPSPRPQQKRVRTFKNMLGKGTFLLKQRGV